MTLSSISNSGNTHQEMQGPYPSRLYTVRPVTTLDSYQQNNMLFYEGNIDSSGLNLEDSMVFGSPSSVELSSPSQTAPDIYRKPHLSGLSPNSPEALEVLKVPLLLREELLAGLSKADSTVHCSTVSHRRPRNTGSSIFQSTNANLEKISDSGISFRISSNVSSNLFMYDQREGLPSNYSIPRPVMVESNAPVGFQEMLKKGLSSERLIHSHNGNSAQSQNLHQQISSENFTLCSSLTPMASDRIGGFYGCSNEESGVTSNQCKYDRKTTPRLRTSSSIEFHENDNRIISNLSIPPGTTAMGPSSLSSPCSQSQLNRSNSSTSCEPTPIPSPEKLQGEHKLLSFLSPQSSWLPHSVKDNLGLKKSLQSACSLNILPQSYSSNVKQNAYDICDSLISSLLSASPSTAVANEQSIEMSQSFWHDIQHTIFSALESAIVEVSEKLGEQRSNELSHQEQKDDPQHQKSDDEAIVCRNANNLTQILKMLGLLARDHEGNIDFSNLPRQLLEAIPRDDEGVFLSVGSIPHQSGCCKPCVFYRNVKKKGCLNGTACLFCHLEHPPHRRTRPSKRHRLMQRMMRMACTPSPKEKNCLNETSPLGTHRDSLSPTRNSTKPPLNDMNQCKVVASHPLSTSSSNATRAELTQMNQSSLAERPSHFNLQRHIVSTGYRKTEPFPLFQPSNNGHPTLSSFTDIDISTIVGFLKASNEESLSQDKSNQISLDPISESSSYSSVVHHEGLGSGDFRSLTAMQSAPRRTQQNCKSNLEKVENENAKVNCLPETGWNCAHPSTSILESGFLQHSCASLMSIVNQAGQTEGGSNESIQNEFSVAHSFNKNDNTATKQFSTARKSQSNHRPNANLSNQLSRASYPAQALRISKEVLEQNRVCQFELYKSPSSPITNWENSRLD